MQCDVRDEAQIAHALAAAVERFGGIDIVVNNASAIRLGGTAQVDAKAFDLMTSIGPRATYLVTRAALPHLEKSANAHVLTLSPPIALASKWVGAAPAYTFKKYGMTLLTLGFAAEFRERGIAANTLWPKTVIATAAVQNLLGGDAVIRASRKPEIVADAAYAILNGDARGSLRQHVHRRGRAARERRQRLRCLRDGAGDAAGRRHLFGLDVRVEPRDDVAYHVVAVRFVEHLVAAVRIERHLHVAQAKRAITRRERRHGARVAARPGRVRPRTTGPAA